MVRHSHQFPTVSFLLWIQYSNRKTCGTELSYMLRLSIWTTPTCYLPLMGLTVFLRIKTKNQENDPELWAFQVFSQLDASPTPSV